MNGNLDLERLAAHAAQAVADLSPEDRAERYAALERGDVKPGVAVGVPDEYGYFWLFWAGRELVRLHELDLFRRDTAELN